MTLNMLKVKIIDPFYNASWEKPKMHIIVCTFVNSSSNPLHMDKPNFQEFWVKMALKVMANDLLKYQPRVSNLVIPAQICHELLCIQGKDYGWTDSCRQL